MAEAIVGTVKPLSVACAVERVHRGESVEAACAWVWMWLTQRDKDCVDAHLVLTDHWLASEPGTAEWRFRELVRERARNL